MSVTEYEAKFIELSRYATQLIPDETTRCRRFQRGLNFKIRKELTGQGEQQEQVNQPDPNARMIEAIMRLAEQNAQLLELQARRPHTSLAKQFIDLGAKEFTGTIDPAEAENWLKDAVRILNRMGVANDDKVDLVAFMFKGEALHWWEATERLLTMPVPGVVPAVPQRITWARFEKAFDEQYFPESYKYEKENFYASCANVCVSGKQIYLDELVSVQLQCQSGVFGSCFCNTCQTVSVMYLLVSEDGVVVL